jgi:hypothetical protein
VYAVVSEQMRDEALELFVDRQMAELMVENCGPKAPRPRLPCCTAYESLTARMERVT